MKFYWLLFIVITISCFSCQEKKGDKTVSTSEKRFEQIMADHNTTTDSLQFVIDYAVNDSLKIEAYNKIFFKLVYSDSLAAQQVYKTLFSLGETNRYAQSRAYNLKGIWLDVKGDYDAALTSYQKAVELASGKYANVEGSGYNNIGLIYWNRGNYSEALSHYSKALRLFETIDNKNLQANVLSNIGLIYMDIKNPEKSDEYFRNALKIRELLNDEYGISVSLTNLAKSYEMRGKCTEATPLYERAVALKIKLNDEAGLSNTLYNQSTCYMRFNDFEKATQLLKKAEQLCLTNGLEANNLTNIYTALGDIYNLTKQPEQLRQLLLKMKALLDKHKDERNFFNYYRFLSEYYELKNDYKNSLIFFKKADSVYNKLESIEIKNAINLYETQYQSEKKEKELANAQLKITETKLVSKQKNLGLILLGGSVVIGLVIFRNYRIKARHKQEQLALENELLKEQTNSKIQEQRLEISKELHDSLGAQLTFINSISDELKNASSGLDDSIHSKINTLYDFSENSIAELKNSLWVLNSKEIYMEDLKVKILNFIKNASEVKEDVKFSFNYNASENCNLNSKQAVNIYRAIQEIINNAIKYADATEIKIDIQQTSHHLTLKITDNGNGFDYEKEKNKSFGLQNIKARIEALNGSMNLETRKGSGTAYNFQITL